MKKCILVVDDAAATLEIVERNLVSAGYDVHTESGVSDAIRFLEQQKVDLVITDLKMPGRNGFQLVEYVRNQFAGTEILMITGYPDTGDANGAGGLKPEGCLTKPFTVEELLSSVNRVLSGI